MKKYYLSIFLLVHIFTFVYSSDTASTPIKRYSIDFSTEKQVFNQEPVLQAGRKTPAPEGLSSNNEQDQLVVSIVGNHSNDNVYAPRRANARFPSLSQTISLHLVRLQQKVQFSKRQKRVLLQEAEEERKKELRPVLFHFVRTNRAKSRFGLEVVAESDDESRKNFVNAVTTQNVAFNRYVKLSQGLPRYFCKVFQTRTYDDRV